MARTKQTAKKLDFAPKKVARLGKKSKKTDSVGGVVKDALPKKSRKPKVATTTTTTTTTTTAATPGGKPRRPHKWKSGTVAKRKVKFEQKNAWKKFAIRKAPFQRMVRNAMYSVRGGNPGVRMTLGAAEIVQACTENYLIHHIEKAYRNCLFYGRVMLRGEDIAHSMTEPVNK